MNAPFSPATPGEGPLFSADRPAEAADSAAFVAADLLAHPRTETPIVVGIFGAPGSGKSSFVSTMLNRLAGAKVVAVRVYAPAAAGDPANYIAARVYRALRQPRPDGAAFAALAEEAAFSLDDPHAAAQAAAERLGDARARLDVEGKTLEQLVERRTRLGETVLYGQSGSRVDAYARANRARIADRLRAFGFGKGEALATYKDLIRDIVDSGGPTPRLAAFTRSLWAFRGQGRLLAFAILFALVAAGVYWLDVDRGAWGPWLRAKGEWATAAADWLDAHTAWLSPIRDGALALAVLCLLLNLWRAVRFCSPVLRGMSLYKADVGQRRRDVDALIESQSRRVDALKKEAGEAAKLSEAAQKRLGGASGDDLGPRRRPDFVTAASASQPEAFLRALEERLGKDGAPTRIVVALDEIDELPPAAAVNLLESATRLLSLRGVASVFALEAQRILPELGADATAARARLEKLVQLPIRVPAARMQTLPSRLGGAQAQPLDAPLSAGERELLQRLSGLSGGTPRRGKRLANLYRLARALSQAPGPALALMLAQEIGGDPADEAALDVALLDQGEFNAGVFSARFAAAYDAARKTNGGALDRQDLAAARAAARRLSMC